MEFNISPILPRNQVSVPGVKSSKASLKGREVVVLKEDSDLKEARALSKYIKRNWNELDPEELAGKIIDLESKVSLLKGSSPAVKNVKRDMEHHHFDFVFQAAKEVKRTVSNTGMPVFANAIHQVADEVSKTNSIEPFQQLNGTQQR